MTSLSGLSPSPAAASHEGPVRFMHGSSLASSRPAIDLASVVEDLRGMGPSCRLSENGLWVEKICLNELGEISLDGRVRGLSSVQLGEGVDGFLDILRRIGAFSSASPRSRRKRPVAPWPATPRAPSARLQGRRAEDATEWFYMFADERGLQVEQIGPARFLVEREIFYNLEASVRSRGLDGARRALWCDLIEAGLN